MAFFSIGAPMVSIFFSIADFMVFMAFPPFFSFGAFFSGVASGFAA